MEDRRWRMEEEACLFPSSILYPPSSPLPLATAFYLPPPDFCLLRSLLFNSPVPFRVFGVFPVLIPAMYHVPLYSHTCPVPASWAKVNRKSTPKAQASCPTPSPPGAPGLSLLMVCTRTVDGLLMVCSPKSELRGPRHAPGDLKSN